MFLFNKYISLQVRLHKYMIRNMITQERIQASHKPSSHTFCVICLICVNGCIIYHFKHRERESPGKLRRGVYISQIEGVGKN